MIPVSGFLPVPGSLGEGGGTVLFHGTDGRGLEEGDLYGTSMVTGQFLGDEDPEVIVGSPGSDSNGTDAGSVFIFKDVKRGDLEALDARNADSVLHGGPGDRFGSGLALVDDMDDDGVDELAIGSTGAFDGLGSVLVLSGKDAISGGHRIMTIAGEEPGGGLGSIIEPASDLDDDGRGDMLLGAPMVDRAYIVFGKGGSLEHRPDLWEWGSTRGQPVTFSGGVNNTPFDTNTFGIDDDEGAGDDGWDWSDGVYGWEDPEEGDGTDGDLCLHYGAPEPGGPDADGVTSDRSYRLEVVLGSHRGNPGGSGQSGGLYSGAWGIQLWISEGAWHAISSGAKATMAFHFEASDINPSGSEGPSYVKARFGRWSEMEMLGTDLGGDDEGDVLFIDQETGDGPWGPTAGVFEEDVTDLVDGPGWYYMDFGALYDASTGYHTGQEGIRVYFDNVSLHIEGNALTIRGPGDSGFGEGVAILDDRNGDDVEDLAVTATELGGGNGGAFIFNGPFPQHGVVEWNLSDERFTGAEGDGMGSDLEVLDLDGDPQSDLAIGSPGAGEVVLLKTSGAGEGANWWADLGDIDDDGLVSFDSGVSTDGNTWGPGAGDDGWDTAPSGIYGGSSSQVRYNPGPELSADGDDRSVEKVHELQIELGGGNQGEKPITAASGAYGIEFTVPSGVFEHMNMARLTFEWSVTDLHGRDTNEERVWVKARLGTSEGMTELGGHLDDGEDPGKEIGYRDDYEAPGQEILGDRYDGDMTHIITGPGTYYLELGGTLSRWSGVEEATVISFDEIYLEIGASGNERITGAGDFGQVLAGPSLDQDDLPDLAILAPQNASLHFFTGTSLLGSVSTGSGFQETHTYLPGTRGLEGGWTVLAPVTGEEGEPWAVLMAAPGDGAGLLRMVHVFSSPTVEIIEPQDGARLTGAIMVDTRVGWGSGPLDDVTVDLTLFQEDGEVIFSANTTERKGEIFTKEVDTTLLPNGNYTLLSQAHDRAGLAPPAHDTVRVLIDNRHGPVGRVISPSCGTELKGTVDVEVEVTDLDMDVRTVSIDVARAEEPPGPSSQAWYRVRTIDVDPVLWQTVIIDIDTNDMEDGGPVWFGLAVEDRAGGTDRSVWGPFTVLNPDGPMVQILTPSDGDVIEERALIRARVTDDEDDLDIRGARFYQREEGRDFWELLGNDPQPDDEDFSMVWDTGDITKGTHEIKVNVTDRSGLTGEDTVKVTVGEGDGDVRLTITAPEDGARISGETTLSAALQDTSLMDFLEDVVFRARYSGPGSGWKEIGTVTLDEQGYGEMEWDCSKAKEGEHLLRAEASGTDGLRITSDVISIEVVGHGGPDDDPQVRILSPTRGGVLSGERLVRIQVEEGGEGGLTPEELSGIEIWISEDGFVFEHLGSADIEPGGNGSTGTYLWNTTSSENGYHFLRVVTIWDTGQEVRSPTVGPVEVRNAPPVERSGEGTEPGTTHVEATFGLGAFITILVGLGSILALEPAKYGALKHLFLPFLGMYSKLKKEKLLDNVLRKRIFKYICDNPGDNFSSIRRKMNMTNGVFAYHLWTLEREEMIASRIDGRYRRFYPMKGLKPPKDVDGLNWFQLGLLDTIYKNEGVSLKDLSELVEESPQVVGYHIKLMNLAGLIERRRDGRKVRHYIAVDSEEIEEAGL